jgi:hypothetical protein
MEINYGVPKQLQDGRFYLKVSGAITPRVMVQLNNVTILTKFEESDDVTLELNQVALEKISGIDAQNIAAAKVNCQAWFGKTLAEQTLEAAYTKSTQDVTMNTSKARVNSVVVTKLFNSDKSEMTPDILTVGSKCDVILEFSGIWFMKKTFGPIWRIAQVRLLAPAKKMYPDEYLFQDEETPEEADDDYI